MVICAEISLITTIAIFIRWSISLNSYSGLGKSPMHGDYEAQRHWMEITYNLPIKQWYFNSSDNDLLYWGLDYPPLTAYHSWICGAIANKINSSWIELHTSRGIETEAHKLFMRYSVLFIDILIYFPAVFTYYYLVLYKLSSKQKLFGSVLTFLYPGLILIDHGHFQYNCVSLGFVLWAVIGICSSHELLGSCAFVLALNYKQMELFHAVPFFCFLLGNTMYGKENRFWKLIKIAVVVILTFIICWFPFLNDLNDTLQVLNRLFPFARGLYEDKVANFWCSISVIIKLKEMFSVPSLLKICLGSTLLMLIPSAIHLLLKPSTMRFRLALVNSSLVFFLFSFQVHEKSILIPSLAVCLLLPWQPLICVWFLIISVFSMVPLLVKDELVTPYIGGLILFVSVASMLLEDLRNRASKDSIIKSNLQWSKLQKGLFLLSVTGCIILTVSILVVKPPPHLPDLLPLAVSVYSCAHFLMFLFYFHWLQFTCPGNMPVVNEDARSPSKSTYSFHQQIEHQLKNSQNNLSKQNIKAKDLPKTTRVVARNQKGKTKEVRAAMKKNRRNKHKTEH